MNDPLMNSALSFARSMRHSSTSGAHTHEEIEAVRLECRQIVRRRAALAAVSSFIPLPGIDLITDTAVLLHLIPEINVRFGLAESKIGRFSPARKVLAFRLLASAGSLFASRAVTASVLIGTLRVAGLRLTLMEATRLVPIAGQIFAAILGYLTLTHIAGRHIEQCAELARSIETTPLEKMPS
jgi:uncharacterized protein (DUF697 family)